MDDELDLIFKHIYRFHLTGIDLYKNNFCILNGYLESDDFAKSIYRLSCTFDLLNELLNEFDEVGDILLEPVYENLSSGWQEDISITIESITGNRYLCLENLAFIVRHAGDLASNRVSVICYFYDRTKPAEVKQSNLELIVMHLAFVDDFMNKSFETEDLDEKIWIQTLIITDLVKLLTVFAQKFKDAPDEMD